MYIKTTESNNVWQPSLKQERFLNIPLSVKEAFYAGALNAGKSDVLLMYPIVHEWHKHPQFKGIFFRRTRQELKLEIIPRARHYFEPLGAKYNAQDGIWTFPSGALYFMGHIEHEKHVHLYDSMQPNYVAFDELTHFTEWMYLYILIERVRVDENLKQFLPEIVRSGSNPGNIGHRFVYKRFIKPYQDIKAKFPEKQNVIIQGRGGVKRVFIPATIDDNPYASAKYKAELEALPDAEKKAKKYGDWNAYEGQVFDEFRDRLYPGEPVHAVHIVNEFEIPSWWPRLCSIDWGYAAMCSIGFGAVSPNKRLYVYRHLMFYQKKIEDWSTEVKFWIDRDKVQDVVICHSANQHRGDPKTILEQVTDALGVTVRLGEKDRVGGKLLLHEMLRWKEKELPPPEAIEPFDAEKAARIYRNAGVKEYNNYLRLYLPQEQEKNLPKLQFFDNEPVKVICDAIKTCVYEKSDADGKKKEDVAEFDGDDPYDMLRMLIHSADMFWELAVYEQQKLEQLNEIEERFRKSQDNTQYYMSMRVVESVEVDNFMVSRFKHSGQHYRR